MVPGNTCLAGSNNTLRRQYTCDGPNCTESNRRRDSDNEDPTKNRGAGEFVVLNPAPEVAAGVEGVVDAVQEVLHGGGSGFAQEPFDYLEGRSWGAWMSVAVRDNDG